jgi:predicted anti-sigma-YlaC factor YlaD
MGNMKEISCEHVRDLMPELLSDQLDAVTSATLRAHLAKCAECAAEYAVAGLVAESRLPVPSRLESRVLAAAVGRRVTFWTRGRMAAAASIAVALIGGSTWLSQMLPMRGGLANAPQPSTEASAPAGFIGVEDAFTSGASSLGDLTVEELQKLLAEMES